MPRAEHQPVNALLPAAAGEWVNPAADEPQAGEANAIDKLFTKYPFFGSRQIAVSLARDGIRAGRHRVPTDGPGGSIQAARDEPAAPGPSGLPLPAEGDGDCAA
jgi:hypothetical protein